MTVRELEERIDYAELVQWGEVYVLEAKEQKDAIDKAKRGGKRGRRGRRR
jgi:hypothetical protein